MISKTVKQNVQLESDLVKHIELQINHLSQYLHHQPHFQKLAQTPRLAINYQRFLSISKGGKKLHPQNYQGANKAKILKPTLLQAGTKFEICISMYRRKYCYPDRLVEDTSRRKTR